MGALATVLTAWLGYRALARRKRKFRLFLSIQMNDLTEEEYSAIQKEVLEVFEFAKELANIDDIYYFNRNYPTKSEFDKADFRIGHYMRELRRCDYFIAIFLRRVHSSIYAEAGYAIAEKKKCFFYTRRGENILPTVLAGAVDIYEHVKALEFDDIGEVARKLKGFLPNIGNGRLEGEG